MRNLYDRIRENNFCASFVHKNIFTMEKSQLQYIHVWDTGYYSTWSIQVGSLLSYSSKISCHNASVNFDIGLQTAKNFPLERVCTCTLLVSVNAWTESKCCWKCLGMPIIRCDLIMVHSRVTISTKNVAITNFYYKN